MAGQVWVERVPALGDAGIWVVSSAGRARIDLAAMKACLESAQRIFADRAEIATVSVIPSDAPELQAVMPRELAAPLLQAGVATLPTCFFGGHVADLVGLDGSHDQKSWPIATFEHWVTTATVKGLIHVWLVVDAPSEGKAMLRAVPHLREGTGRLVPAELPPASQSDRPVMSVGIDAAWLLGGESGAQVLVFEMLKELARRAEIDRIVLLSETGGVPRALDGVTKIDGVAWPAALGAGKPLVDIVHRPYQPGLDVDYRRYHRVAGCVAVTVLDFIAYDNPAYHESDWSWRQYQQAFDENVCLADCVFAISAYIGSRIERQFAHQLSGPVLAVPLGTDHVNALLDGGTAVGSAVVALDRAQFLLVLGNDFEHKNRDFAVKVFADMRDRGYAGQLVLAGFHLDDGSSYGHELAGVDRHLASIVRIGALSAADKTWLLQHADAVLYPTSSEGFGLLPFEAAALGTPTAFVRFGPLRETMPRVAACRGWQVRAFADHVFDLIANRALHVEQVRAAGAALTWASHVDQVINGYLALLANGSPWRTRTRELPGSGARARRAVDALMYHAANKIRRLAGKTPAAGDRQFP